MNSPQRLPLPDIQSLPDLRAIAINRVGILGLRHPISLITLGGEAAWTVATVEMAVALPATAKGTHMSRFLEVLQAHGDPISVDKLPGLLHAMLRRLEADEGTVSLRFPYFVRKSAPVSGVDSLMDYDVTLRACGGVRPALHVGVVAPVTSLCPCSKEISAYGAHNQRSAVTIEAELAAPLAPEDLIAMAERAASCELYGLLKRPDEKYVTERAYDNPKFVEDLVRDVALELEADARVAAYRVASENFESIHNHSAYAVIQRDKRSP
ncbi:MAG: GTP cyclohydrolase I FolE2 [Betaproteobacteria bacterium]|nr:GTP cyclohydrolase I FolE2 [Betaproteobacteria bacterium]